MRFVRYIETARSREGPLWEVLLYYNKHTCTKYGWDPSQTVRKTVVTISLALHQQGYSKLHVYSSA